MLRRGRDHLVFGRDQVPAWLGLPRRLTNRAAQSVYAPWNLRVGHERCLVSVHVTRKGGGELGLVEEQIAVLRRQYRRYGRAWRRGDQLVQQLQPGGNATGFMSFEYSMAGKWLELLKQIAPGVNRVAVLRDAVSPSGNALFGVIQAMAPSVRVEVTPVNMRDAGEIERSLAAFARTRSDGLIVTASGPAYNYRDLIIALAARHKLPAVYYEHVFAASGGLVSYGSDFVDQYRQAARYVDRILKGEKPADLPVQAPTKFELVINLKTARALGLTVPPSLLASANEVIE